MKANFINGNKPEINNSLEIGWLITINTNKPDFDENKFKEIISDFISDFLDFLEPMTAASADPENIESLDNEIILEKGPVSGLIHSHILIKMKIKEKGYKLPATEVRNYLREKFGGYTPHLDLKFYKENIGSLKNYVKKTIV